MARKSRQGYYVDGEFVTADSDRASGDDASRPSRTARKNASEQLQKVGEDLVTLRAEVLERLPLPERLRDAVVEARRLSNFGAKRRQLQFIGKLMRGLPPDVLEAVQAALECTPRSAGR